MNKRSANRLRRECQKAEQEDKDGEQERKHGRGCCNTISKMRYERERETEERKKWRKQ